MNDSLAGLTLHMLRTLDALVRTGSVSRTADELGQTQPAVSISLRRLRETLNDPLLVRSGSRLVPTSRASSLQARLHELLADMDQLLSAQSGFEAGTAEREFRIATADCMQAFFLPALVAQLQQLAPATQLRLRPLGANFDFVHALEDGRLDGVIGNWPDPPEGLKRKMLLEDEMVCLLRPGHPVLHSGALDLETYLQLDHVAPEPYMASTHGPVDGALAALSMKRRIKVTVPEFSLAGYLVADSDMVFTSSRHFANYYADLLGLAVVEAPPELPPMRFYMLWHERAHEDPGNRWLRQQIEAVAMRLDMTHEEAASTRQPQYESSTRPYQP